MGLNKHIQYNLWKSLLIPIQTVAQNTRQKYNLGFLLLLFFSAKIWTARQFYLFQCRFIQPLTPEWLDPVSDRRTVLTHFYFRSCGRNHWPSSWYGSVWTSDIYTCASSPDNLKTVDKKGEACKLYIQQKAPIYLTSIQLFSFPIQDGYGQVGVGPIPAVIG